MKVQVRGCKDRGELERAAQEFAGQIELEFAEGYPKDDPSVRGADGAICFLPAEEGPPFRECFRFVRKSIDRYPYVPVVVVGVPLKRLRAFTVLGAARVLPRDAAAPWILRQTRAAIQATWWWGANQFDEPVVMVDRQGTIIRANRVAKERISGSLINQPYRIAVERAESPELPPGHPVRDVFESGLAAEAQGEDSSRRVSFVPKAVCRYVEYPKPGADAGRAQLACVPVLGLRNLVRAVAVLFVDMDNWTRTIRAASVFARQQGPETLYQIIVEEVGRLGYCRARLYEYDERKGLLWGRASIGLSLARAEDFRNGFRIRVEDDPPSQETVRAEFPRLCFHKDVGPIPEEGTELLRGGYPSTYKDELELEGVNRWMEVPLRVPLVQADGTAVVGCWGKLSVDDGLESDRLDVRDVADIALFAQIASSAIGMIQARQRAERHLNLFRTYSEGMAGAVWQAPNRDVRPEVVELLLELYLELTGADVAFFRQLRAGSLWLQDGPKWRGSEPPGVRVPTEERSGEGGSARLLEAVDAEGRIRHPDAMSLPVYESQATVEEVTARLRDSGRWDDAELAFRQTVGRQVSIPLVIEDSLRGVIVAVTWDARGFSTASHLALRRFTYTAPLWFAFAELRDSRFWSGKTLGEVIAVLSELVGAETDERLYAGLAAILSAHCGIGWNRVLVFDCQGPVPGVAELVYALGGLGGPEHLKVIERVKAVVNDLKSLVRERIRDPVPHGSDPAVQADQVDPLYATYVQPTAASSGGVRAQNLPVRIVFGPGASTAPDRWFRELLTKPGLQSEPPLAIPLSKGEPAFDDLRAAYPGLLCADRAFVFPIWQAFDRAQHRPLAFVVLDNPYRTDHPPHEMQLLTRALLDLVGDIMTFRNNARMVSGCIGALPTFAHDTGLKDRWDSLYPRLDQLLEKLATWGGVSGVARADGIRQLKAVLEQTRMRVERVCEDQKILRERLKGRAPSHGPPTIPDLGRYLDRIANAWEQETKGLTIDRRWADAYDVPLDCDPYPLKGVLRCLLDNAVSASRELHPDAFHVTIRVTLEPWPGDPSRRFAVIRVTDTGSGIRPEARDYLFMEDFTFRKGPSAGTSASGATPARNTGLGLSIARALTAACHGDLQVEDFGRPADPATGAPSVGATFVLRLCVVSVNT